MPRKLFYSIIAIVIIAILGIAAYFLFYLNRPAPAGNSGANQSGGSFNPFGSNGSGANNGTGSQNTNGTSGNNTGSNVNNAQTFQWPKIREIWQTPIGGFIASSTASSTFVRFVDRGTGFIYDMNVASATPVQISNTTVPLVYQSYWGSNAMSGIFRYIKEGSDDITNFYVKLNRTAVPVTSASATPVQNAFSQTPFALRGSYFPGNIIDAAISPKGTQIFTIESVDGNGVGFISNLDGSASTQIFSTPLTQVRAYWPTAGTVMMATKASANSEGYLYSINVKTGAKSEILGSESGLSVLPNSTGQFVAYSDLSSSGSLVTSLYNVKTGSSQDLPFVTLADKCVWSRVNPLDLFCAVPAQIPTGTYPDDWYKGTDSPTDKLLEIDTDTGTVHQISDLIQDAKTSIDAESLSLDPHERYLYFINKKDLSLWSVDLDQ
jgi:hypothetical protein